MMTKKCIDQDTDMPSSSDDVCRSNISENQDSVNRKKTRKMIAQSLLFAGMVNQMSGYTDALFPEEASNETIDGGD